MGVGFESSTEKCRTALLLIDVINDMEFREASSCFEQRCPQREGSRRYASGFVSMVCR